MKQQYERALWKCLPQIKTVTKDGRRRDLRTGMCGGKDKPELWPKQE